MLRFHIYNSGKVIGYACGSNPGAAVAIYKARNPHLQDVQLSAGKATLTPGWYGNRKLSISVCV